jgi:hypothetical protein
MRKVLVAVLFLSIASSAFAGTITSLSPNSFQVNSGEYFITVFGTAPGNVLVFDGPAGHFERTVNATFSDRVVGWVPEAVIAKSGTHSLKVRNASGIETNSLNFTVFGLKFFPLAIFVPDVLLWQPDSREGAVVKFDVFAGGGEDPNPVVNCNYKSGEFFKMGVTRVHCTASNSFGERSDADFDINVTDRIGPVVTVPEDIRIPARSNEGAVVDFDAKADDAIWGQASVDCLPKSGSMFRIGRTVVSCTAVDFDLNGGHASFFVDVIGPNGTPKPLTLVFPSTIMVAAKDPRGEVVDYTVKVSETKDPNPIINCTPKSGSLFPLGYNTVQCDALDSEGAWGQGNFEIQVLDVKPPDIRTAKASPDRIPVDGRLWPITISTEVTDDLDLQPTCAIFSVTANEDIDLGDNPKDPKDYDWAITGPLTVELRGENTRTTRVYNVWVACTDFFGNLTQANVQVAATNIGGTSSPSGRRRAGGKP